MRNSLWPSPSCEPDTYALFRGSFSLPRAAEVEFRVVGSAWYLAWLDGQPLLEGPLRFALDRPEYQIHRETLRAGEHLLGFHLHHIGLETRILKDTAPFLWCELHVDGERHPMTWRCKPLCSQESQTHRINPQLGWAEWRDTRLDPEGWELPGYDDSSWGEPLCDVSPLPEPSPADLAAVKTFHHPLTPIAEGPLATTFAYPRDDPSWAFYSRDRSCTSLPARGLWRRYDLGRVRLGRASFRMELPAGTVVEFALAESLTEGRVGPQINLSLGPSCNLDRFIARGGEQTFEPLTPKGGRFLEVHVVNATEGVRFLREDYLERCYHDPSDAAFSCGDPLLETIWQVGIETYRACAEDALIDNPTRERGQWVGDVASVGMAIASAAFHDLRLCRRTLVQAALCPREDGLVAGMSPGGCVYLPSYAFQWAVAVEEYVRHTGDRSVFEELWEPAQRNLAAIRAYWKPDGLHSVAGWNFVDWGYRAEEGPVDTACNLHYLWCLRAMERWALALGRNTSEFTEQAEVLAELLRERIAGKLSLGWEQLGYHCAVLAMHMGLINEPAACLDFMERHLENCFPNCPDAPRNDDPNGYNSRLITPYFAHYTMPLLIEAGRMDFVLDQFRKCWGGFMLEEGRTTWVEVFDTRWTHCHQWSGCPTWLLSRYVLGLHPAFQSEIGLFDFRFEPGSLQQASGRIPHPLGGWIDIQWHRDGGASLFTIDSPTPLRLRFPSGKIEEMQGSYTFSHPISP